MERKLVLGIDFNNVIFSHYYSKKLTNMKGYNVQAIKGFMYRMKNLRDMFNPDYIVIANDVSRERTFRRELYSGYKAGRKSTDEDFRFQMGETLRMLAMMGYPIINHERYEADDVLGMISRLSNDLGMDCVVVSADRDLYQLVNDNTTIWSFRNDILVDKNYMEEEYKLTPEQWIDLKILQGDQSDNIPGIPGIGHKTALELMQRFGSLASIYEHVRELSDSLQNKLFDGKDRIPLMRQLVTIVTDYRLLNLTEKNFERMEAFDDEVYRQIEELELPSITNIIKYDLLPVGRRDESNGNFLPSENYQGGLIQYRGGNQHLFT